MKISGIMAAAAAILLCTASVSCEKKEDSSKETSSAETSQSTEITSAEEKTSEAVTTSAETTSENTTETTSVTTVTTAAQEKPVEINNTGGKSDSVAAVQEFYNAYLAHDAEKVYSMFCEDEIKGYTELVKGELEGKDPAIVFSKAAIVSAIDQSMTAIGEIREAYSDTEKDEWSVKISGEVINPVDADSVKKFNDDLKMNYTDGVVIQYIYYMDNTNGQSFTGNSSAFLYRDGKWYLSFSSLMQSELLNYLEV